MSFAAVVALVAAYEAGAARIGRGGPDRRWPRPLVYLASVVVTSLVAGLATAPFGAYHFHRVAVYSLLANLIAVPLTAIWVMPCAVAAFLLMPFGLDWLVLVPMGWGVDAVNGVAFWVQGLSGAVWMVPVMPPSGIALIALGGLWICLWQRRWRWLGTAAVAAGFATMPFVQPPDLMVDGAGRLFGVRGPDGRLALSSARAGVAADTWLRRTGQTEAAALPGPGAAGADWIGCDRQGCIYRAGGQTVALARSPAALAEDCARASVVVSPLAVRRRACPGPVHVIDRWRLARDGPHALWLAPDGVRIETVRVARGERPWTGPPPRYPPSRHQ